jgi:hypothetical protein
VIQVKLFDVKVCLLEWTFLIQATSLACAMSLIRAPSLNGQSNRLQLLSAYSLNFSGGCRSLSLPLQPWLKSSERFKVVSSSLQCLRGTLNQFK